MENSLHTQGVVAGRLTPEEINDNFSDLHPPLDQHEAMVAADRCYFCHDAPCITACPTAIDIPLFIRQISTGTPNAAAETILSQNILGGMCARVCPTETLCEQACVREVAEGKPVLIGQLQRYATDSLMAADQHPFEREDASGKRIAIVGSGPAGLACAHRLAMKGHDVVVYDARSKSGGLNEYGIAAYKSPDDFAQVELDWLLKIGGITIENDKALGRDIELSSLQADFDAVFLGFGLAATNTLAVDGDAAGVVDAVDWISEMRQSKEKTDIKVGRNLVVIGGGMTAVDAAVQSKLLGAENVTIAYRRGKSAMSASQFEQDLATSNGVRILMNATPKEIGEGFVRFSDTETGEDIQVAADQVMRAIGQRMEGLPAGLDLDGKKIKVDETGRTSLSGVWAGGDCTNIGEDLTVAAVAQGRDAAENIHLFLSGRA